MAETSQSAKLPPYLLPDRQIYVIISTRSGTGKASDYFSSTLQPVLESHAITHTVHTTSSITSIIDLISTKILTGATKGAKQTILLLSGDGGPTDIVNTLSTLLMRDTYDNRVGSIFVKPVIVLFPLGTANALAWSSGIADDPIRSMLNGRARPLPQFQANFSPGSKLVTNEGKDRQEIGLNHDGDAVTLYGAVVFSWGLHASLVSISDTTEYRKHGVERFKMAAAKLMEEAHQYRGTVKFKRQRHGDWEDLVYPSPESTADANADAENNNNETIPPPPKNTHIYTLLPLVSRLEEHFRISPLTTPLSSTLRLLAIRPTTNAADLTRILTLAYQNGAHVAEPSVVYHEINSLRIEFDEEDARWRQVCVDGKIIEVPAQSGWAEIQMLPSAGMDGRRVVEVVVPS